MPAARYEEDDDDCIVWDGIAETEEIKTIVVGRILTLKFFLDKAFLDHIQSIWRRGKLSVSKLKEKVFGFTFDSFGAIEELSSQIVDERSLTDA